MEQNPNNQQKHSTRNNNTRTGNSKPSEKINAILKAIILIVRRIML